jgi:hypothetical protein
MKMKICICYLRLEFFTLGSNYHLSVFPFVSVYVQSLFFGENVLLTLKKLLPTVWTNVFFVAALRNIFYCRHKSNKQCK